VLGVLLARPLVSVVGRFAARFSVRALDVTVDGSLLWVGAGLAMVAAVVLAYVPRLPSQDASAFATSWLGRTRRRLGGGRPTGLGLAGGVRMTASTNRRLKAFAVTQVALSFVLLTGAGMLLAALVALQTANTGYDMRRVLAFDVPMPLEAAGAKSVEFVSTLTDRVGQLPGVEQVAVGNFVPWRDVSSLLPAVPFSVAGHTPTDDEDSSRARLRNVTPGFFAALGVPIVAGRDFSDEDRRGTELVVIVSRSVAERLFPGTEAVNRRLWWLDPYFGKPAPRRIVGVVANVDDENVEPGEAFTIYHPFAQMPHAGRLFVRTSADPYTLELPVKRIIREVATDQPVERAATLEDVRAEVLAPERLNAFVFSGFAGVALLIAVVGVAGVLAFSVSARTREFGMRLAIGSTPRHLLALVLAEGTAIAAIGIAVGVAGGYGLSRVAAGYLENVRVPGALPVLGAATVLIAAAVVASLVPAARASRADVLQALRSE
jgi:predicted permease